MLHYVADQISKLPTEIRDQLPSDGKIESRLRRLDGIDISPWSPLTQVPPGCLGYCR